MRFQYCDTVFLLDYPLELCLLGAESRVGKKREDLPWLETEFDSEFKQYIIDFSRDILPQIYGLIEKYRKEKSIIIFKSREESETYLHAISGEINLFKYPPVL